MKNNVLHISNTVQQLIPLSQPEKWRAALNGIDHAFGHTWESCYAMHLTTGLPTFLYLFEKEDAKVVCPISEREFKGFTDIVTPYGFSGFAGNMEVPDFENYWKEFVKDKGYVCGYIGLNPLFERACFHAGYSAYSYNRIFFIDLEKSIQELFAKLSANRKRQLKQFESADRQFVIDKKVLKDIFISNFHSFFSDKNASGVYNFSVETLSYLIDLENVVLVGLQDDSKIVAMSLFAHTSTVAEYLFNISLPGGKQHTATLIWWAVHHFKAKHIAKLNLGGGVSNEDSLADFKKRFGGEKMDLKCLKQIYQEEIFINLCQANMVLSDVSEGFFPPYRKGVPILPSF